MSTDTQYSVVLLGRYPGKDRPVATALAREFGMNEAWGLQVVGAAPIIVLDGITSEQAQLVHEGLAEVEQAGSKFEVQYGPVDGMSKISWPAPPRLHGKPVSELGAAPLRTAATLIVPCPYTGQKMKLTIIVQATKVMGESGVGAAAPVAIPIPPAAAAAAIGAPVPVPTPAVRPPSKGMAMPSAPLPVPMNTPVSMPAVVAAKPPIPVPVPAVGSAARHPAQPQLPAEPPRQVTGLESLEELIPMEQFPPAPVTKPPPRSPQHGTAVAPRPAPQAPLPDVPILHSPQAPAPPRPVALPEVPEVAPMINAPMDLAVFEQKVSSSGIFRANQAAPAPEQICSVFMGKTNNPKVHQLLAELQGVGVPDAAKLCQKALVAIAKDINMSDAQEIKERFAALGVAVRIAPRK